MGSNKSSNDDSAPRSKGRGPRFFSMAVGSLVFVGIVAIAVFFVALRGEEESLVPDVRGKELTAALIELQAKELYPRIQLRYSQSSRDKGFILEQEPVAGTIVKAGRRIRLVVSQGAIINRIENYIGRDIEEVRMELQTILAASGVQLLTIKDPLMYDFSSSTPGLILLQKPEPGTDISGPTELEFVVSQGQENALITVPEFTGLTLRAALDLISRTGVLFEFSLRDLQDGEQGETIVYQEPPPETTVTANTQVNLVVSTPSGQRGNEVFALFTYAMPVNPYPLPVLLEALTPMGERVRLLSADYLGGNFTVPYRLPRGSILILSLMNRELHREIVVGD